MAYQEAKQIEEQMKVSKPGEKRGRSVKMGVKNEDDFIDNEL